MPWRQETSPLEGLLQRLLQRNTSKPRFKQRRKRATKQTRGNNVRTEGQECTGPEQKVASVLKDSKNAPEARAEWARWVGVGIRDGLERRVKASSCRVRMGKL